MGELRNKHLSVKLTEKEFQAVTEICRTLQISKSVFIRSLIHREFFE